MGSPRTAPVLRYYDYVRPKYVFIELQLQHGKTNLDETLHIYRAVTILAIRDATI